MFPPGRAMLATKPLRTGSGMDTNTTGTVRVVWDRAATTGVVWQTIRSGCISTSSLANARAASGHDTAAPPEQRDELAPFHCAIPPMRSTQRIAHLSYGGRLLRCGSQVESDAQAWAIVRKVIE